ncbi:2-succinyl-5-enolpyruvyl-6-hydroxy-3-cyclohexene-1-carboxylic-acid synthase [marine bacterium AO1-C]|nr:2-succinyl-5-enolpyruvyl-6-hydroxy-3-cyclohexene-1-carboxylic-acid synthase [marine bacterium AO1-C]
MIIQPLLNIAEICARKGLTQVVLSPGSRCAHLVLAFVRHPQIKTYTITDERSAAFVAMGLAQQSKSPVALVCTSGSAALNYAPAIAEAYYQQVPLVVMTADRPPEWIDQLDGQTIRQQNIYGRHIKASFQLPVDFSHQDAVWHSERQVNEAINLAVGDTSAPVHLNIPIREPFYPTPEEQVNYDRDVKIIEITKSQATLDKPTWNQLLDQWDAIENKLIVAGQHVYDAELIKALNHLQEDYNIPIVGDVISNTQQLSRSIKYHDTFLGQQTAHLHSSFCPELLITYGQSLISKSLKLLLRKYRPRYHWHIGTEAQVADTFQSLTHHIPVKPTYFFSQLFSDLDFKNMLDGEQDEDNPFANLWQQHNQEAGRYVARFPFADSEFSEFEAIREALQVLPENTLLHLANSMAVRYANFIGLERPSGSTHPGAEIFANRGTSGIDGSVSTAVGTALAAPDRLVTLITGDLAFFYDRNGLWNNYLPQNLRILLMNNHAGGIFRIINGPKDQPELEEYFETQQPLNAENTARDFNLDYTLVKDRQTLQTQLSTFFEPSERPKILEIETNSVANAAVLKKFREGFVVE